MRPIEVSFEALWRLSKIKIGEALKELIFAHFTTE
jgi:hypothetical protein